MHTGINNPNFNYQINGKNLSESYEEKDLGIIFQSGLKWGAQVEIAAAKANRVVGQIRSSFRCRDPKIVKLLYWFVRTLNTQIAYEILTFKNRLTNLKGCKGEQRRRDA